MTRFYIFDRQTKLYLSISGSEWSWVEFKSESECGFDSAEMAEKILSILPFPDDYKFTMTIVMHTYR